MFKILWVDLHSILEIELWEVLVIWLYWGLIVQPDKRKSIYFQTNKTINFGIIKDAILLTV